MEKYILNAMICGYLLFQSYRDIRTRKITVCSVSLFGVAELLFLKYSGQLQIPVAMAGVAVALAILLFARLSGQMIGYGDGAVMLNIGIAAGGRQTVLLFANALFLIAVLALFLLAFKKIRRNSSIPFIPFLAAVYLGSIL